VSTSGNPRPVLQALKASAVAVSTDAYPGPAHKFRSNFNWYRFDDGYSWNDIGGFCDGLRLKLEQRHDVVEAGRAYLGHRQRSSKSWEEERRKNEDGRAAHDW